MKKLIRFAGTGLLLLVMSICIVVPVEAKQKLRISYKKLVLRIDEDRPDLIDDWIHVFGTKKKIKWSNQNPSVVKISELDKNGITVTALKNGQSTITARAGKQKIKCKVTVITNPIPLKRDSVIASLGITDTMKDQYKAFLIAKWICDNVTYTHDFRHNGDGQTYQQAMTYGTAVCAGYAATFDYFMRALNIPSEIVMSDKYEHDWNKIKIDGEWYVVDVTFMDGGMEAEYDPLVEMTGRYRMRSFLISDSFYEKISQGFEDDYYAKKCPATSTRFEQCYIDNVYKSSKNYEVTDIIHTGSNFPDSPWFDGTWVNY